MSAVLKRMVCLANSKKMGARCVAGREMIGDEVGGWIRPVSSRETEEVSASERRYSDGGEPQLMDIIEVPLIEPRVNTFQPENWLLDPSRSWTRAGRIAASDLERFVDRSGRLWLNGYESSQGTNDRIPEAIASGIGSSLMLIHVDTLQLDVLAATNVRFGYSRRQVRGRFHWRAEEYCLSVTDPTVEDAFVGREEGRFVLGPSYLTISLAEPFHGDCYKLIAAVIEDDSSKGGA
jgi:hypothetical protein